MSLKLHTSGSRSLTVWVESFYSILTVKKKIERDYFISARDQSLMKDNKDLANESILSEIGFVNGTSYLFSIDNKLFYVYCMLWPGVIKPFYVRPSDTILMLRQMIEQNSPVYPSIKSIRFGEKSLENDKLISFYNIKTGDMLNVIADLSSIETDLDTTSRRFKEML